MGGPPNLNVRLDNPINTITDIATLPTRAGLVAGDAVVQTFKDPLMQSFGIKTEAQKKQEAVTEAANAEQAARTNAYNSALGDKSLDQQTLAEIKNMYASGADSASISGYIASAKEGKGVFAPRRVAQNEASIRFNQPGRSQIYSGMGRSGTLGSGYKIGRG